MAWITKNSSSMQIPRRSEPYLTAAMQERLSRDILPRYEVKQGALLPVLHELQHAYGWIPYQALEETAAFLGLRPSDVWDTASFYEEFWLQPRATSDVPPRGEHVIAVCRSIACEVCDHRAITSAVKAKLGIEVGETTEDGRFTLVELECLGLCEGAPAALVDEEMIMTATPESIVKAIDAVASAGGHKHH